MARAKQREAWDHTAWLCCVIANHAFGQKTARKPDEFNPIVRARPAKKLSGKASLELLRATFSNGRR